MRAIIALIPGAPAGNISLDWTEDPFISKTVRRAQALIEYQAGLFDRVTTLIRMGVDPEAAEAIGEGSGRRSKPRQREQQADGQDKQSQPKG